MTLNNALVYTRITICSIKDIIRIVLAYLNTIVFSCILIIPQYVIAYIIISQN